MSGLPDKPISGAPTVRPSTRSLFALALVPPTIVAVVFTGIELARRAFFASVPLETQLRAHLALDVLGMYATTTLAVALVLRDRTRAEAERARERERKEEERVRTASLAAIGELAAAVAHEVKNPLQGILGAIDAIARDFPRGDRKAELAEEVIRQIRRLDATVRDLLIFSRPQVPRKARLELRPLVEKIYTVLRAEPDHPNVVLEHEVANGFEVTADGSMLEEALLNLIINAAQATEETGGRVTLRARRTDARAAEISISDTGRGIPPEIREEVWKPFYTTKHRGSGLGLTIVRKIIEAHGGRIALESEVGRGTVFTLTLPEGPSHE